MANLLMGVVGLALACRGLYQHQKATTESEKQRALYTAAAGVYFLATTVLQARQQTFGLQPILTEGAPLSQTCSLHALHSQLMESSWDVNIVESFVALDETLGISCDNYLPWKKEFYAGRTGYIDGIQPEDMKQSVMWGSDPQGRLHVTLKYTCDKNQTRTVALFHPHPRPAFAGAPGGHQQADACKTLASMHPVSSVAQKEFLNRLRTLLRGEQIEIPRLGKTAHVMKLA